jgi:hypothetical protein
MTKKLEAELADRLESLELLKLKGYSAHPLEEGGVLLERWGHARGIWQLQAKGFSWTPAGYNAPLCYVDDVEAAVRFTIVTIEKM